MLPAFLPLKRLTRNAPGDPSVGRIGGLAGDGSLAGVCGVAIVALLVRGAILIASFDQFQGDPDAYRAIAETLGRTGVYGLTSPSGDVIPTAFRPPLYPLILSWGVRDGHLTDGIVAVLHLLLGVVTAVFTYLAATALLGSHRNRAVGILAALLVIVDPILIQQSTLVMTETLATALASLILWWWMARLAPRFSPSSAIALGSYLALAYLCRPTFLVWALLLLTGLLVVAWFELALTAKRTPSVTSRPFAMPLRRCFAPVLAGLVVLAGVGVWMSRNVAVIGHPVWATTHGGYTLLLGNNPLFYRHLQQAGSFQRWDAEPFLNAYSHRFDADPREESFWLRQWSSADPNPIQPPVNFTEHDDDRLSYESAMATIHRSPWMFAHSCLTRVYRLWTPIPFAAEGRSLWKRIAIGIYYSLLYAAALIGLIRLTRSSKWFGLWPIVSLIATLTIVHAVYWSNMRMRAPAIPAIAIVAALAIHRPHQGNR